MDVQARIGIKIRKLRKESGYTLDSLAEKVGLASGKYLGLIERGKINVTLETLGKIASGLGLEIEDFFAQEKDPELAEIVDVLKNQPKPSKTLALKIVRAIVD